MKKILFSAVVLFAVNSSAQQITNYGLKAGLNFANLNSNIANQGNQYASISMETQTKVGFYFGGYAEKKYSEKGSLVGEALISLQGAKLNQTQKISYPIPGYPSQSQSITTDVNITQLNIPVYYKYNVNEKFSVHGGGYLGLILGSKIQSVNFNNNTIDFGLLAGASYKISEQFSADARYNFGLLKLDDFYSFQNRVLQLGISYQLK